MDRDIRQAEIDEVVATLQSRWLGTEPRTQRLESDFRDFIGCAHARAEFPRRGAVPFGALQEYYRREFGFAPEDYPNANDLSARTLSPPLAPQMNECDVDDVIAAMRKLCDHFGRGSRILPEGFGAAQFLQLTPAGDCMLYLLVGPTGVGKSALGNAAAAAIPNCKFYELDKLVASNLKMSSPDDTLKLHGPNAYWRIAANILQTIKDKHENSPDIAICSVGRNALDSARARSLLVKYPKSILLWSDLEEAYRRSSWWPERQFRQYLTHAQGTYARVVYDEIGERCRFDVTGMNKEQAINAFVVWFKELIAPKNETSEEASNQPPDKSQCP